MEKLLIVEDVQVVRNQLISGLGKDYVILEGTNRGHAMELFLRHAPKVVTLDLGLRSDSGHDSGESLSGASEGFCCLEWMMQSRPETKIVVLTEQQERDFAYRAVGCGAYDFYQKPIQLAELKIIISRAFYLSSLEAQRSRLQEALGRCSGGMEEIAGQCAAMQELFSSLQRVTLDLPETGTGETAAEPAGRQVALRIGAARLERNGPGRASQRQGSKMTLPSETLTLREVRDRVEKGMVTAAVGNCGGNMARASELLGVSRPALYDLLKKHGLFKRGTRQ